MSNLFVRILLFISSYFPLLLIFCILLLGQYPWWISLLIFLAALFCVIFTFWFFQRIRKVNPAPTERIATLQSRDGDVMSYIASYLIPFVTFPLSDPRQLAALLIFFLVLLLLYVNSNLIYINPTLNLFGYHLYAVTLAQGTRSYNLITRQRVVCNDPVKLVRLGDDILLTLEK